MASLLPQFERHLAAMQERYPALSFRIEDREGIPFAVWEGWLTPIRHRDELNAILCDVDANRSVHIDSDASIRHDPDCRLQHGRHPKLKAIKRPDRAFRIGVEYGGGPAHPRGYLLDPEITSGNRRHIMGRNRICAYEPWKNVWNHDRNDVADFADHILLWLVRWNIWVETEHWPGDETSHDPFFLLANIQPTMECWCGSAKEYGECCRSWDVDKARVEMAEMLKRRSSMNQKPRHDKDLLDRLFRYL